MTLCNVKNCRSLFLLKSCRMQHCLSEVELAGEYSHELIWRIFLTSLPKMTALHKIHKGKILPCQNSNPFVGTNGFLGFLIGKAASQLNKRSFTACSPLHLIQLSLGLCSQCCWQPCLVTCSRFSFSPTSLVSLLIC